MTVIDVRLVPVVPGAGDDPAIIALLDAAEREAVAALGFAADRDRAATARAAARCELGRRFSLPPEQVPLATRSGRPTVAGAPIGVSWAHSGGWVALALAPDRPVGVDIEEIPEQVPVRALARIGLATMEEFVALEAAGKAAGHGLVGSWPQGVRVEMLLAPAGYVAAVGARGLDWSMHYG